MKKRTCMLAVAALTGALQAETYYFALTKNDEGTGSSGFTAAEWSLNKDGSGDLSAASAGNDYVLINKAMRTPDVSGATSYDFPGETLTIGSIEDKKSGSLVQCGGQGGVPTVYKKLIMARGKYITWRKYDAYIDGPVEVTTTEGTFNIGSEGVQNNNGGHHFRGPFTASSTKTMIYVSSAAPNYRLTFAGDMSAYKGRIKVSGTEATHTGTNATLRLTTKAALSGQVFLEYGAAISPLSASDVATVGELSVKDRCRLIVPCDWAKNAVGKLVVTDKLTLTEADPLIIELSKAGTAPDKGLVSTVIAFKDAENTLTKACFVLPELGASIGVPVCEWSLTDADENGMRELKMTLVPYGAQNKSDDIAYSGVPGNTSMTNATGWTIEGLPNEKYDYYTKRQWLNTPYSSVSSEVISFGGRSLWFDGTSTLLMYCYNFRAKKLVFQAGTSAIFNIGGSGTRTIYADEVVIKGTDASPVGFECYQNSVDELDAPLTGTGVLRVRGRPSSGSPCGGLRFAQDNSSFGGRFYVYCEDKSSDGIPSMATYEYIEVSDAKQLGGPCAGASAEAPQFNALELRNYSALKATDNVTLAEPTRGVYINTIGQFVVNSDKTLTLNQQLTIDGECNKAGSGTLVLGGALKFGASAADTPTVEKNKLTVSAGSLVVAAGNAVDGAAVTVAQGAKLAVRHDLEKGFSMVKENSSLTFADGTAKLNVDFAGMKASDMPFEKTVVLCTVSDTVADTLRGKLSVALPSIKGYRFSEIRETKNDDNTVTFDVTCMRTGLMLILK